MLRILEIFFKFANFMDRRKILEGLFLVTFVPSDKIIRGIKYIVDSLSEFETDILITSISVDLKNEISEFYFHILRQIFFPKSNAKYSQTLEKMYLLIILLK